MARCLSIYHLRPISTTRHRSPFFGSGNRIRGTMGSGGRVPLGGSGN